MVIFPTTNVALSPQYTTPAVAEVSQRLRMREEAGTETIAHRSNFEVWQSPKCVGKVILLHFGSQRRGEHDLRSGLGTGDAGGTGGTVGGKS